MVAKKRDNIVEDISESFSKQHFEVGDLDESEAKTVLKRLIARGGSVSKAVKEEINRFIVKIDIEELASEVYDYLDQISVEELWDRSGSSRYGYTHPSDEAWTMIEEVLKPYVERIGHYQNTGMLEQAREYCLGVLEGIYTYGEESSSEFRDWAPDDPKEAFSWVFSEWKKKAKDDSLTEEFGMKVEEKFPDWSL